MMPDKVYLEEGRSVPVVGFVGPAWNNPKDLENPIEFIRKDALVERINKQILFYQNSVSVNDYEDGCNKGAIAALEYVVKSL